MSDLYELAKRKYQMDFGTIAPPTAPQGLSGSGGADLPSSPETRIQVPNSVDTYQQTIREGVEKNIADALAESPNPEEAMQRWQAATIYGREFGIPTFEAYNSLDMLASEYFTEVPPYKTLPKAFADSFKAAKLTLDLGKTMSSYMGSTKEAFMSLIGKPQTEEDRAALKAHADELVKEISELQIDRIPKNWLRSFTKMMGGVLPYTGDVVLVGAAATAATAVTGGLAGVAGASWFAAVKSAVSMTARFAEAYEINRGLNYLEMTSRGISEKDATIWSSIAAAGSSAVESIFSIEAGISSVVTAGAAKSFTESVITRLGVSGILTSPAAKFAGRMTLNTVSEMLEEGSQSVIDGISTIIAQEAQANGIVFDPLYAGDITRDMAQSMWAAAVTSPFLGLPTSVLVLVQDKKALIDVAKTARYMGKDEFIDSASKHPALQALGVSEEERKASAGKIWDTQAEEAMEEARAAAAAVKASAKTGRAVSGETPALPASSMFIQADASGKRDESGNRPVTYLVGFTQGAQKGEAAAQIDTLVSDDSVIITGGVVEGEAVPLSSDMIAGIAARNPGKQIIIGTNVDPAIEGGFERFMEQGGPSKAIDLSIEDAIEEERLISDIMKNSQMQRENSMVAVELLRAMNTAVNGRDAPLATMTQYLKFGTARSTESQRGKYVTTGYYERSRDPLTGAIDIATSMINLASDLPEDRALETISHEAFHYFRQYISAMAPDNPALKAIEAEYGITDREWDISSDEKFVAEARTWMANRRGAEEAGISNEKIGLFERFADFFRALYEAIKTKVSPAVASAMEEWFGGYESREVGEIKVSDDSRGIMKDIEHPDITKAERHKKKARAFIKAAAKQSGRTEEYYSNMVRKLASSLNTSMARLNKAGYPGKMRASLITSGAWVTNPQLVAELKWLAGEELEENERELLNFATNGNITIGPLSGENLYSKVLSDKATDEEIGQYLESSTMLYSADNVDESVEHPRPEVKYENEAKDFKSFDSWIASMYADPSGLSEQDRQWLQMVYDNAHKAKEQGKRFKNKGDFARFLGAGREFYNFIFNMGRAIYGKDRLASPEAESRAAKLERSISQTPELKGLVDKMYETGDAPTTSEMRAALSEIRRNEPLYKYAYAVLQSDQDLAFEAISELDEVPLLVRRDLMGSQEISIAEQEAIIDALKDARIKDEVESLGDKIRNGTITIEEMQEYSKVKDEEYDRAMKAEKTRAKGKIKEERAKLAAYKKLVKERNAARKMLAEMRRLEKAIFRRPSSRVDYATASLIMAMQEALKAEKPIDKDSLSMMKSFYATHSEEWRNMLESFISSVNRDIENNGGALSLQTTKLIAETFSELLKEGRRELRNKEITWGLNVKSIRADIVSELMHSKYWKPETFGGSKESEKRKKQLDKMSAEFDALRPDAFFKKYLGKRAASLLFDESVRARSAKYRNYDRRTSAVTDFIAQHDLMGKTDKDGLPGLAREMVLKGVYGGGPITITGRELLGIRLLLGTEDQYNEKQREALIYGNFFTGDEKNVDGTIPGAAESANEYMTNLYESKVKALLKFVDDNLTAKEEHLAKLILASTDNEQDWSRFASAIIFLTNKEPTKEKFYFPIIRDGEFGTNDDEIVQKLKSYGVDPGLDGGMAISRIYIQPRNHKRVKLDAISNFYSSISKQEHLIEVGPYAKRLMGVFSHGELSQSARSTIKESLGQKTLDYIDAQIDVLVNPVQYGEKASGGDLLRMFRGSQVIANLAFRLSSFAMQMLTSPLPGLAEAPLEMFGSSVKAWKNPLAFVRECENKSAILKNRQLDPQHAELLKRREQGMLSAFDKVSIIGMSPLSWADRFSVSIVWDAVYRKRLAELEANGNPEDGSKEARAIEYADRFTLQTQPTSDMADRSPMYREMNTFKALVLQFTQPLNVIYNNIRMDVPEAVREREYAKAIGFLTAYTLSGLAIGLIGVARGRGPEDDDQEAWLRYWLHASTSQFTDAIPFVGEVITGLTGTIITGDNNSWMRLDRNMPAIDFLARSVEGMTKDQIDWFKVVRNATMGMGQMAGAPMKAIDEAVQLGKLLMEGK